MSFGTKSAGDTATSAWANLIEDALGDGNPAQGADFVIFLDGTTYKARNGVDGTIDYSDTDEATVIQAVIDALSTSGGKIKFENRTYTLDSQLTFSSNTNIDGKIYVFEGPAELRRNFTGATTFLWECTGNTGTALVTWKDLAFNGLYDSKNQPLINLEGTDTAIRYIFKNCLARYGLPTLRMQGALYLGYFDFPKIYVSQGYSHAYTGTEAIILIDGIGAYADRPKCHQFNFNIDVYDGVANPIDYYLYLDGGYNVFHSVQMDGGYCDESPIYILGWSNRFNHLRVQDVLTTANTDATIHLTSTSAYSNWIEGYVPDMTKTVKIAAGAFRNYIKLQPFGAVPDIDTTGAGIENVIEFVPPHLASATPMTISDTAATVIYRGFGVENYEDIEHHTAADTLTTAENGSIHTNLGAGGDIKLDLPQDAWAGVHFEFVVMAAHQLQIEAGAAGGIYIGGAKSADDVYIWADDEGESVKLVADGNGDWVALYTQGTWTVV